LNVVTRLIPHGRETDDVNAVTEFQGLRLHHVNAILDLQLHNVESASASVIHLMKEP
jgi:hypothetical protein